MKPIIRLCPNPAQLLDGNRPHSPGDGGPSVTNANLKRIMIYVINSTRVTTPSINSAPDPDASTPGRAMLGDSRYDPTILNPAGGDSRYSAILNPAGGVAGDGLTTRNAHVSITGADPQTPHLRMSTKNKDLRKSCKKNIV